MTVVEPYVADFGLGGHELMLVMLFILWFFQRLDRGPPEDAAKVKASMRKKLEEELRTEPSSLPRFRGLVFEALDVHNRTVEFQTTRDTEDWRDKVVLWLAQGFGLGRIPIAPGTFGSVLGLLWLIALVAPGSLAIYMSVMVLGFAGSVWLCGEAEKILGRKDPSSVVLDEIVAVPLCFAGWIGLHLAKTGQMPTVAYFVADNAWAVTLALFAGFRLFDILKPWPVKQSQRLPGGWGVTVDDLLAALYVNLVFLLFASLSGAP